jgi:lipid II:glycine glycyltransferase (peptidoglycan interpeptide bridge formation enzyme)
MSHEVVFDDIDKAEWGRHANQFADYSVYQTWPYQQVRAEMAGQEFSRAIVKDQSSRIVAMCHIRIKNIKSLGLKIGYVQQGPLVRAMDGTINCSTQALRALRETCLGTKVNVLRVVPNICDDETGKRLSEMLKSCGFQFVGSVRRYRTLTLHLEDSEEAIRKSLDRNFRRNLKKAEKAGIEIREGYDGQFCKILEELYLASIKRKGFKGQNPQEFIRPQLELSAAEKMNIIVAYCDGEPVSVHLSSSLGNTAVALLVASNERGLACGSSYLVWWKACISAKRAGMKKYDLGGIDPEDNPGGYQFKSQISSQESFDIGTFDACNSSYAMTLWHAGDKVRQFFNK